MAQDGDDRYIGCISKEKSSHGEAWRSMHGAYFSDPAMARPLLDEIEASFAISRPDAIADIGGGDGFMLLELSERAIPGTARLVNVDASEDQLEACKGRGLERVCRSAMELERADLIDRGSLTLISRSVLHYFGREGQPEFLGKMRSLLRPGEVFVHQPACFTTPELVACMNELYPIMGVDKAYYTPSELEEMHHRAGFEVLRSMPGPSLDLRSEDLAARYNMSPESVQRMVDVIRRHGLDRDGTFTMGPGRFRAAFTYRILTLRAR